MSAPTSHAPSPVTISSNPCLSCGACCAAFRVSFYWAEAPELDPALTEQLTPHLSCMRGSNSPSPRCVALQGEIGGPTSCSAYADRPPPCREVQVGDDKCQRARARHGLSALPAQVHPDEETPRKPDSRASSASSAAA